MKDQVTKRRSWSCAVLFSLAVLLIVLVLLNITLGSVRVSPKDIAAILLGRGESVTGYGILLKVRLPRVAAGMLLGGALALSGYLLQTFFNNPIADPYVLGISSGAKLAVAVALVTALGARRTLSSAAMIAAAFSGAMLAMSVVLLIARTGQRASMLIVSGVMIGYICSAITDFVITFADDASIVSLYSWSKGSFSGTSWQDVLAMAIVVLLASVIVFFLSKPISAYQLGEDYARSMGVNIRLFRVVLVLLSSVLCACVSAFAGPVSFVGIAVPHLIKWLLKTSRPLVAIPACFLGGAIFCLLCDLIARTVFSPTELSLSSVTAVFGAPVVIGILLKKKARG